MTMINRRHLIRNSLKAAIFAPVSLAALQAWAQGKAAKPATPAAGKAAGVKMVPSNDPVATALKYHADAAKAPRVDKMGTPAAQQHCGNCQLFTKQGEGYGKCTMIASGMVAEKGWCSSWIKKS